MNRHRQTVRDQIAVHGTDSVELVYVDGIPVGDHLLVHLWRGRWTITHRPTGCAIDTMPDGRQARALAEHIRHSGYDIAEAYTKQAVEDIRGLAEKVRWQMASEAITGDSE